MLIIIIICLNEHKDLRLKEQLPQNSRSYLIEYNTRIVSVVSIYFDYKGPEPFFGTIPFDYAETAKPSMSIISSPKPKKSFASIDNISTAILIEMRCCNKDSVQRLLRGQQWLDGRQPRTCFDDALTKEPHKVVAM